MKLSGSDIIVRTLIEQGTDVVFGYPGGQVINIYDSLYKYQDELKHILTAHEQGAPHAADGLRPCHRQGGRVHRHLRPRRHQSCHRHRHRLSGLRSHGGHHRQRAKQHHRTDGFQEIDITGVTLPITKHNYFVGSVDRLAPIIREAFKLAKSGRPGPGAHRRAQGRADRHGRV